MNSFTLEPAAGVLSQLFQKAAVADRELTREITGEDGSISEEQVSALLEEEARDYRAVYRRYADHYLNVSPEFGKFLYMCARTCQARRIIEFGTSYGVSSIYLASALRDNGGGQLIGTELEPSKAAAARASLTAAGLVDLVDIRVGDALETLREGIDGQIDMVHLDGAFSLYLPVLKLLEPHMKPGTLVIGENSFGEYIEYVRDLRNGYLSMELPFEAGRGNEFSIVA